MSVFFDNDDMELEYNQMYVDLTFFTPGRRVNNYIDTISNAEVYGALYSPLNQFFTNLFAGEDFVKIVMMVHDYCSDECEHKVHIYFKPEYKEQAERTIQFLKFGYEGDIIIENPKITYFYQSTDDISVTLKDDKTTELENLRKESKNWQERYEKLWKKCRLFSEDLNLFIMEG